MLRILLLLAAVPSGPGLSLADSFPFALGMRIAAEQLFERITRDGWLGPGATAGEPR